MKKEEDKKKYNYITVEENMYIVDNMVQKYKGETIWLEIRKDLNTDKVLTTRKIVYLSNDKGNYVKNYI